MNWETYIAFGDSITVGARTYLGYPELVADALCRLLEMQWNVTNHSVSGYKAIDLARDIDKHFLSLKEKKASVSTILIGTNDVKEKTSPEDFKVAVNQVMLKAKLLTMNGNVIVLAIPSFQKGIVYPYSFGMNDMVTAFNEQIKCLAAQHGIRMLELNHATEDFTDGVHLSRRGLDTFSNQIAAYILKDKGIVA